MLIKPKENLLFAYETDHEEAWDDFLCEIGCHVIIKAKCFFVEGSNMGWRQLSGYTIVKSEDSSRFMKAILPKTNDLSIDVFKSDKKGVICEMTIYHHDSPTGEYRTIYAYSTAKKMKLIPNE